ncbi:hypothetical protein KJ980_01900 [Patescibacteria group bacterium]|nr:hypothetical protein [Patescibacteria group bacterium]MBU4016621.1 hypothetical protein [Patescibacteria group bacterium]MBU4098382.1 hypothetical protein [Patescibacteria group bacterium]
MSTTNYNYSVKNGKDTIDASVFSQEAEIKIGGQNIEYKRLDELIFKQSKEVESKDEINEKDIKDMSSILYKSL